MANKAARPTRQQGLQGSQANEAARPIRQTGHVPALISNIFVAPTNRLSIDNKTGGTDYKLVYFIEMSMDQIHIFI